MAKISGMVRQEIMCDITVIPVATVVSSPCELGIMMVLRPSGIESEQRMQTYAVVESSKKLAAIMKRRGRPISLTAEII